MIKLFRKSNSIDIPNYWKDYQSHFEKKNLYNLPIGDNEFVVLDIESNGLNPKKDKILSIGAVKIKENEIDISNSFELFLEQHEYNPEVAAIHGIRKNGNQEKVTEKEALKLLIKYIDNRIIVGHSVSFDIAILNETLKNNLGGKLLNKYLDTVILYKRLVGGDYKTGNPLSLDDLSDEFHISKSDRHNAAGDALITAFLFLKIVARLKKRGIETVNDLLKTKRVLI